MTESKVGGLPPLPDIGPEGWYTRTDMIAYARAALSAHGALLFTQADMERFAGYVADAREERLKSAHGQPVVDEVWLRQAIEEFKYLSGRTDLPMQDRERWRALTAALGATP